MDFNITSIFVCFKIIGGAMIERGQGGRIIDIASISGMIVNRGIGGRRYETAKAALIQFTRATAAEWAWHGVTVNAICPGGIITEPNQPWEKENPDVIEEFWGPDSRWRFWRPGRSRPSCRVPGQRAPRYMTDASLVIDGGYTLW